MIEILVVVSLIMIGIFSTFSFIVSVLKISNLYKQTTQANDLAIEALEARQRQRGLVIEPSFRDPFRVGE